MKVTEVENQSIPLSSGNVKVGVGKRKQLSGWKIEERGFLAPQVRQETTNLHVCHFRTQISSLRQDLLFSKFSYLIV